MKQEKAAKNALIIFVKNPVPGKVKTRLARSIGDPAAAEVYRQLLRHTESITRHLSDVDRLVYYGDYINPADLWTEDGYHKRLQSGDDLGERMNRAFAQCFAEGYQSVVIIGSDCAELTVEILQQAFRRLEQSDVVIGPAADGGYYLLGMKERRPELFAGIAWSTAQVLKQTVQCLEQGHATYSLLQELSDIDELEDYERIRNKLKNS